MIIHRGTLTLQKLKELSAQHLQVKDNRDTFNPAKNNKAISIIEQSDGNFKGEAFRNGKLVEIRAGDPNSVLLGLMTHNGNTK